MLEGAAIAKSDRVLEIGAGSGYLAALAAKLGREVCAVERHEALVQRARTCLRHLGCRNVDLRPGDGTAGWPDGFEGRKLAASGLGAPRSSNLVRPFSARERSGRSVMKWMLVVLIGGLAPVNTDLVFDKFADCLSAEERMRKHYADAFEV